MSEERSDDLGAVGDEYYTTDVDGMRVLYGLTLEETDELEQLRRAWWRDRTARNRNRTYTSAARRRKRELEQKHHRIWFEVVGATSAAKQNPTVH